MANMVTDEYDGYKTGDKLYYASLHNKKVSEYQIVDIAYREGYWNIRLKRTEGGQCYDESIESVRQHYYKDKKEAEKRLEVISCKE